LRHYESLSSVSQHIDFKKIASEHEDYLWLHERYKAEINETAKEYKAINIETNEGNKIIKIKDENQKKIRENQPLPPIPIITDKDLPEVPSEYNNSINGSIKENPVIVEDIRNKEYLPQKESDNNIAQKKSENEITKDEFKNEISKKETKIIDFE